jgi:hypothetical protein
MKAFIITLVLFFLFSSYLFCQVKTTETRTTTDSTGKQVTTSSVILSKSEDITPRSSMIIINPLKFFLFYNISFYTKVSSHGVVGVGIQSPTISGISGVGLNAEYRIHPAGKAPRGFYFAPNISYNSLSSGDLDTQLFSIGALIGWQWFPGDDFAIGLGIGIDYYTGSNSNNGNIFGDYHGKMPAVRFDIGYAW